MIHVLTSNGNILSVEVRNQEARIGDSAVAVNLALILKSKLSKESFAEQKNYLISASIASYIALNKIDQKNRFKASVNLKSIDVESINFIKGSSSAGLGYALALFNSFWTKVLKKGNGFTVPVFATGEVTKNGDLKEIGYLEEKIQGVIRHVQENGIKSFYLCIPKENKAYLSKKLSQDLFKNGGQIISANTLPQMLGMLLGDEYDGNPLNRWEPFKSLKSFEYEDSMRFFGRQKDVERLYDDLQINNGVLIVSGPSGAGKSSLIKAGLIPLLAKEKTNFYWLSITPNITKESFLSTILHLVFSDHKDMNLKILEADIRQEKQSAFDLVGSHLQNSKGNYLLHIDQFEDCFVSATLNNLIIDVKHLHKLAKNFSQIKVVFSIRNEYISELLNSGLIKSPVISNVTGNLPIKSWEEIVIKQASFSGIGFEQSTESLAQVIINEAINTKNALPVVEFVLSELYKKASEETKSVSELKIEHYKKIGGLSGAISNRAQQIIDKHKLPEELVSKLFEHLVGINVGGLPYARKIHIDEVKNDDQLYKAIQYVINSNLIENHANQIRLAHDCLFESWLILKEWITQSKEYLLWRETIEAQCQQWKLNKKKSHLLKDSFLLKEASNYLHNNQISEPYIEKFILESLKNKAKLRLQQTSFFIFLPLIIVFIIFWDKNQSTIEYYHAEGLRWGVPFGISELNKTQRLKTKFRYKFIYRGGWITKLLNNGNQLTEVRYETNEGHLEDPNRNTMKLSARRQYTYKNDGSIDTITYTDKLGNFIKKHTVQMNNYNQAYVFIQDEKNRTIDLHPRLEGLNKNNISKNIKNDITRLDIRFNNSGFITEMFYLDGGRVNPQSDIFGVSGFRYTYNDRGLLETHTYLDHNKAPIEVYGYVSFHQKYSVLGLVTDVKHFDSNGQVTENSFKIEYDEFGNLLLTSKYLEKS